VVVHRVVDDVLRLVLIRGLTDEHHGDATLIHDRRHVSVVEVDQ